MIVLLLVAAAATSPAPVLYAAQARSIAYRDCVAAQARRRPATVAEIGRGACGRARSRLVEGVRDHVSFGWAATAKTAAQSRRLKAQLKLEAESQVAAFDDKLQAWLAETGARAE
ncbi:MAG TPA: hypothetical protein VF744_14750 [Beijerinckiaceae bacterium]|jgi:hypothetical protein